MIYIVIGPSCAGKSTFVKNSFIKDSQLTLFNDIIKVTESDYAYLIGDYTAKTVDGRLRGTDAIARQYLKLVVPQINNLIRTFPKDVVIDGDKIYSHNIFDALVSLTPFIKVELDYIWCSEKTSIERNKKNGATMKESAIKALSTKPYNLYMEYKDKFYSHIYNTEGITDWSVLYAYNDELFTDCDKISNTVQLKHRLF